MQEAVQADTFVAKFTMPTEMQQGLQAAGNNNATTMVRDGLKLAQQTLLDKHVAELECPLATTDWQQHPIQEMFDAPVASMPQVTHCAAAARDVCIRMAFPRYMQVVSDELTKHVIKMHTANSVASASDTVPCQCTCACLHNNIKSMQVARQGGFEGHVDADDESLRSITCCVCIPGADVRNVDIRLCNKPHLHTMHSCTMHNGRVHAKRAQTSSTGTIRFDADHFTQLSPAHQQAAAPPSAHDGRHQQASGFAGQTTEPSSPGFTYALSNQVHTATQDARPGQPPQEANKRTC